MADAPDGTIPGDSRGSCVRHRPMRLLLLTPFYSPGVGGSSRLLEDIVGHLVAGGDHVDVLTFGLGDPKLYQAFDRGQPYQIHRVPGHRRRGLSSAEMVARALLLSSRGYDMLLCGAAFPTAVLAGIVTTLSRTPYAVYSHGEDITAVSASPAKRAVLRRALLSAQLIMANSSFTAARIVELGVRPERVAVVPPGIDPAPYRVVDEGPTRDLRSRLGLQDRRIILTVARLTPRKGHDTIIRALPSIARRVPDVHYLVVGHGDPARLQALADELGVGDRVTFLAYVAEEELPVVYRASDIFAMTSRWDPETREVEGFGMVYLEAGAAGRAVVAGSHGGCTDAVLDGESGLIVDPTCPSAVSDAVSRILSEPELARRMGAAGHAHAMRLSKATQLRRIAAELRGSVP